MDVKSITRVAALIGEAGRIQMLTVLLDSGGHSASELAMAAAVSPQTASSHLAKLLTGGLVVSERSGRQRLFRLTNADVAAAIEALGALAQDDRLPPVPELRFARTCYDHLAGMLACDCCAGRTAEERCPQNSWRLIHAYGVGRALPAPSRYRCRSAARIEAFLCSQMPGLDRAAPPHWRFSRSGIACPLSGNEVAGANAPDARCPAYTSR